MENEDKYINLRNVEELDEILMEYNFPVNDDTRYNLVTIFVDFIKQNNIEIPTDKLVRRDFIDWFNLHIDDYYY